MEMLTPTLTSDSHIPIYQQLYHYMKEEIKTGHIPYNCKLPSKRKLSTHLGISQNTIQAAYDQLIEEGYIHSLEKKGFYVNKLDHLQTLKVNSVSEERIVEELTPNIQYDFSYHGVDFSTFPFDTWRRLSKEVINEYDKELLQLGDSSGYYRLRSVIATYLHQSRGVNCTMEQVIISSGTEMLFQSLIQLFNQNYIYGIENPGYERLNQLFRGNRAAFTSILIDDSGMIPEEVDKNKPNVLCITPAHQFPSGQIMPINRRIRLLNWANQDQNRYIIEDDYDSEFKYSGKPIPALQGIDENEKVIYMGSLSKSISPTLRVSYMVLPLHLLKRYRMELSYQLCPVPIFEQKVLTRFIEDGYFERHLNKMRNIYKRKRELLVVSLQNINRKIKILGADAGLHLLIQVPNDMSEEQLLITAAHVGIRIYKCSSYYSNQTDLPVIPTILLGYAMISEQDIEVSCKRLQHAWYPNQ
ncbi:MAG: transcriptional regulator, GntR family with aminotransferase domain [Herbinix sp.]|jgi:GntR family transcriptional regulator/MocR family aminotransferase|nr:transcriptional regulator, GntR family with aminotransferase domain [Herbinix sp.]